MDEPLITVSGQSGTNNSFDVTSVGFDLEKKYNVAEFNQALKKADEKWLKEIWDGISYPNDIVIVTIENLHNDPCTYRFNFSDAEFHSIQEIVALSPTPMHASISTEDAIEVLNRAETDALSKAPDQENFIISQTANNTFVVKSDSETFGKGVTVFESNNRDECVEYVSQRQPPRNWQVYVIKDLLSWSNPELVPERSKIEYFDTVEDAVARFNEYRNSPYSSETVIEKNYARLTLGMSSEPYAVDILHVRDNQNYLVEDFDYMQEMNTDRNFLDTLAKITADVGFERIIVRPRVKSEDEYYIGKAKDISFEDWDNPYFREGSQMDFIIQSRHVEKAVKSQIEKAFPVQTPSQEQGISHITKNAELSATGRKDKIMATKMECTGMVMLAEGSAKAVATVTINDEFAIKGIKVYDGKNGLFVSMPQRECGKEGYKDVIFPVTAEARNQLHNTVLETYGKLVESGLDKLPIEKKEPPEKSVSKIDVTLRLSKPDNDTQNKTRAVGQIMIDKCIVISGVTVKHGTNQDGVEKDFVSMPSYKVQSGSRKGSYNEYAFPVTAECRAKVDRDIMDKFNKLQETRNKDVKRSESGEKGEVSSKRDMNTAALEKKTEQKQTDPKKTKKAVKH